MERAPATDPVDRTRGDARLLQKRLHLPHIDAKVAPAKPDRTLQLRHEISPLISVGQQRLLTALRIQITRSQFLRRTGAVIAIVCVVITTARRKTQQNSIKNLSE